MSEPAVAWRVLSGQQIASGLTQPHAGKQALAHVEPLRVVAYIDGGVV